MAEATRGASPAELRERVAAGGSGSASEPSRHGHAASVDDIVRGDLEIDVSSGDDRSALFRPVSGPDACLVQSRSRSPGTPAVEEEASLHAYGFLGVGLGGDGKLIQIQAHTYSVRPHFAELLSF